MSLIPQRKKSPEELAALHQQQLAQLAPPPAVQESPPPPAPFPPVIHQEVPTLHSEPHHRHAPPEKRGTVNFDVGLRPQAAHLAPTGHSGTPAVIPSAHHDAPRKQHPLRHGTPHLFDGLRPEEATSAPLYAPSHTATAIPSRKHSDEELLHMRRRDLLTTRPPVAHIRNMALNPFQIAIAYAIAIATPWLTHHYWNHLPPKNWLAPVIGCGFLLIVSLLIYLTKKRARHHAAIFSAIALVTIGFCILFTIKNPYAP